MMNDMVVCGGRKLQHGGVFGGLMQASRQFIEAGCQGQH